MDYLPRIVDDLLEKKMRLFGGVLIEGCKWCGKSTTAKRKAKSIIEFQNPATYENNLEIARTRPDLLLGEEKPLLIDEWQVAPAIWDTIRYDVDKTNLKGQYLLTGSATPLEKVPKHSGTGRIARLLMRPMSLYESKNSTGEVSLKKIFDHQQKIEGKSNLELEDIAFLIAKGGWPSVATVNEEDALLIAREYLEAVIHEDIQALDGVDRNPTRVRTVLRSLARNISTTANLSVIKKDTEMSDDVISEKTIADYIKALEKMYLIEDVVAWSPKLRSKTEIRVTPKREFVDPSLAVAALRATDKDLLKDFKTFGLLFEALCIRDLRIYMESLDGEVFFYRDRNGLEADAILHLNNGDWAAVEIKLGTEETINEAAQNLLKLKNIIDMREPKFLMVLTATKYAYQREDGVLVVPIGCLKN